MSNNPDTTLYEFGPFRFDPACRRLWRAGEPVTAQPKALELLAVLLERRGQELEKDELMELLWPGAVVEESNLTVTMSVLRKALGERAQEPHYVVTMPGRGYRFVAAVRETPAAVEELIVQASKVSVVLEEEDDEAEQVRAAVATALPSMQARHRSKMWEVAAATALLGALLAGVSVWRGRKIQPAPPLAFKTLAVLPFKSLNPKADAQGSDEYLGVGLADVLITRLSNLRQLAVRPTSSVLPFSGKDALQAGQTLKVDSVLDGSIQQQGDRVRVTVRLLRTSDGQPLWAYQCDTQCSDIFQLQDLVAARLTEALELRLTGDERQRLTRHYTDNAAAYQAYLKGRYHTLQFTPEGNRQAIAELNEAIRLDPSYALAYAGLADTYTASSEWLRAPREALGQARLAAEKALALDDTLAEAHAALGHVFLHQFNPAAEAQFQRALELNPNSVAALFFYGEYLASKDADKALTTLRRVQQLDPLSPTAGSFSVWVYVIARRADEALTEARKALELDPQNPFSRQMLAVAYGAKGNHVAAIAELEQLKPLLPTSQVLGTLGMEYALAGRRAEALKTLAELNQMAQQQYVSPFDVALVYTGLGDKEQAFAYLEKAREDQSEWLGLLKVDARLDSLRADPRFADLLRRVGLT